MASIFNGLYIGYSGLNASQVGINTTGHNISNAETEGYTRQRVVNSASHPVNITPGAWGNGVTITEITRVFDNFVYTRLTDSAQNKEASDFIRKNLEELSTYFPEIDQAGIKSDLQAYYDLWQSFVDNPDNNAIKVALAQQAKTLSEHVQQTRAQVRTLQGQVNEQIKVAVDEVNRIGAEIAELNKSINEIESSGIDNANDLRDRRNLLELSLAKLIGSSVFASNITSNMPVHSDIAHKGENYSVNIAGFNFIDGSTFHKIGIDNTSNPEGFYSIYYERQDGHRIPLEETIKEGRIGAILELRGTVLDANTGLPSDGILQGTVDQLDAFAAGLIEHTNNLYAQSVTQKMQSNETPLEPDSPLINESSLNIREGSFDVLLYDVDGNVAASRTINITATTVMDDGIYDLSTVPKTVLTPPTANSIVGQFAALVDDNADNNPNNDIDDFLSATFQNGVLNIDVKDKGNGYTFAISDNRPDGFDSGTNFAGAIGLHRFFDGNDGKNISLHEAFKEDPTLISAHKENVAGNNAVAMDMVQMQFESFDFNVRDVSYTDSVYGFFDMIATGVGSKTNAAILANETITAQFSAIEMEHHSISKVSIDEEMTNLIRYQTAYGAAAKVITTVDQMMTTLLGIKQ